ncbi:MAG: hypothetical protein VX112_05225 [Pseudomonadota bacterium]|nr:hypothetical protein [Pseudomonadota bacterium]
MFEYSQFNELKVLNNIVFINHSDLITVDLPSLLSMYHDLTDKIKVYS